MIISSTLHAPISIMPILKTFLGKMPIYIKSLIFLPLKKPSCSQLPFFTFFYYLSPTETEKLLYNIPLCFQSADFNIRPFTFIINTLLLLLLTLYLQLWQLQSSQRTWHPKNGMKVWKFVIFKYSHFSSS